MKVPIPSLLLITDSTVCTDLTATVASALQGGVTHVLLREKKMAAAPLTQLAKQLLDVTNRFGAYLLIHDRLDVALVVQAAGVHLPESGLATGAARQQLDGGGNSMRSRQPMKRLLGRSCHSAEGARQALQEGADYVTLSPLFATRSHPDRQPLGLSHFSSMCAEIPGPVLALGGVHADNVAQAMQHGAAGVAMIRGILNSTNPCQAAKNMVSQLKIGSRS